MAIERDDALWLHAQATVSIVELAECSGLTVATLRELVEFGAFAPADPAAPEWVFSGDSVARARTAARLREDLELETEALALVLSLLDRIEGLEAQLRYLKASR
jgi:chaperone modulatory protein CbpM